MGFSRPNSVPVSIRDQRHCPWHCEEEEIVDYGVENLMDESVPAVVVAVAMEKL